jgi:5-methylcytosine-specific restriction endonuclease McrA
MSRSWQGGSTTRWRTLRAAILQRDHHRCTINAPGCTIVATCVDHIVQREHGGGDEPSNLRAACMPCNLGRKRTPPTEEPPPKKVSSW